MKKVIPRKIANKVFDRFLSGEKNRVANDWTEQIVFKPETNKISNKFFKNKVTQFAYKCKCEWCIEGKLASTKRKIEKLTDDLNDYIQER